LCRGFDRRFGWHYSANKVEQLFRLRMNPSPVTLNFKLTVIAQKVCDALSVFRIGRRHNLIAPLGKPMPSPLGAVISGGA
jgi:hypothetical protein